MDESPLAISLLTTIRELDSWGRARRWLGPDPYEAMNATRLRVSSPPIARRVQIQLVKLSPLDLRPLLGIEPRPNAAGLGHVLSAKARMRRLGVPLGEPDETEELAERLVELRSANFDEACWGYHFDVQTRFFFYGADTPNTIATSFAAQALLDAHATTGDANLLELAMSAGDFFLRHVPQTKTGSGAYFGYLPGDRTPIHNANLLVASLLARLGTASGRRDFEEASKAAVSYAIANQSSEGSWPYAELPAGDWVDGFHTGYILDGLLRCATSSGDAAAMAAYERGLTYYAEHLFTADHAPKYFAGNLYPIDGQSVAQGIRTFALASLRSSKWLNQAEGVYRFALTRMRRRDGSFIFQRRRLWKNATPHIRWVQAPMLDALTLLYESVRNLSGSRGTAGPRHK